MPEPCIHCSLTPTAPLATPDGPCPYCGRFADGPTEFIALPWDGVTPGGPPRLATGATPVSAATVQAALGLVCGGCDDLPEDPGAREEIMLWASAEYLAKRGYPVDWPEVPACLREEAAIGQEGCSPDKIPEPAPSARCQCGWTYQSHQWKVSGCVCAGFVPEGRPAPTAPCFCGHSWQSHTPGTWRLRCNIAGCLCVQFTLAGPSSALLTFRGCCLAEGLPYDPIDGRLLLDALGVPPDAPAVGWERAIAEAVQRLKDRQAALVHEETQDACPICKHRLSIFPYCSHCGPGCTACAAERSRLEAWERVAPRCCLCGYPVPASPTHLRLQLCAMDAAHGCMAACEACGESWPEHASPRGRGCATWLRAADEPFPGLEEEGEAAPPPPPPRRMVNELRRWDPWHFRAHDEQAACATIGCVPAEEGPHG